MREDATHNDRSSSKRGQRTKKPLHVHYPQLKVPAYFTDRIEETKNVIQFLEDDCGCILALHGRHGVGKSALVGRALRRMNDATVDGSERGRLLIYVDAETTNSTIFTTIRDRLVAELGGSRQRDIDAPLGDSVPTVGAVLTELAADLDDMPCLIVIDKFEHVVEEKSRQTDLQTTDFLAFVASGKPHPFKVILTTTRLPDVLKRFSLPGYRLLALADGLGSPHGEKLLRNMDQDARFGLKRAPQALLERVLSVTHGYPLAIERFLSMLRNDPLLDVERLTEQLERAVESGQVPAECESLLNLVVGEAFRRLSPDQQLVMQAVSAYEEPVPMEAIDFLLEKWPSGLRAADVLRPLLESHLIALDLGLFHLHKIDRDYALGVLQADRVVQLRHHAAGYFAQKELPTEACRTEGDLQPQFAQFKLYLQSGARAEALAVLERIAPFLTHHGFYLRLAELARWLSAEPGDLRVTARALHYRADALWCMGEVVEAFQIQTEIDAMLSRIGASEEERLESTGRLIRFGLYRGVTQETLKAARGFEKKLASALPDDKYRRAFALHNIVGCEFELGFLAESLESQRRAYALAMDSADASLIESATLDFALIYSAMGDMKRAGIQIETALELSRNNRNARLRALHLAERAWHAAALDHLDDAMDFVRQARAINEKIGDLAGVAYCTRGYADILLAAGRLEDAQVAAEEAWNLVRELRFPDIQYLRVRAEIALARLPQGKESLAILPDADTGDSNDWAVDNLLGTSHLGDKRPDKARRAFERARLRAELYLGRCSTNVEALGAHALALAGLACCSDASYLALAKEAYAVASLESFGAGTRKRLERRLKALRAVDKSGVAMKLLESVFPRPKVYVSYRWTPESIAAVDQLMREAPADFWPIRDVNQMHAGDSIDEFMRQIGASEHTIVVLSDEYLRSINCMTELLYMWQTSMGQGKNLMQRIMALVVGPLPIGDFEVRRAYGIYWAGELRRARAALSNDPDCPAGQSEIALIQKLTQFQLYTTDILAWFADTLRPRSGKEALDAIIERLQ